MSMVEERALAEIVTRLGTIAGVRVDLEPDDENPDLNTYPAIAVLPGEAQPLIEQQRQQRIVTMPVMIRGLTQATPASGNDGLPLTVRTAGYALLSQMLAALFPGNHYAAYVDRLGGVVKNFTYQGHVIYPRDDGGKTVGIYIDTEVEYVLHLNDPET